MFINNKKKNKGFVLLFAVMVSSIILAVTLGVANVLLKEIKFGTSAKDTNNAFLAADTGTECALFNDRTSSNSFVETGGSGTVTCLNNTIALNGTYPLWNFVISGLGNDGKSCAKVIVDKSSGSSVVTSKGYNVGDSSCVSSDPNRVERELQISFNEGAPSSDGSVWTPQTAASNSFWTSITYSNDKNLFVAVASGTNKIMTSSDGTNWTLGNVPEANQWSSVTYGNGTFVAVASYLGYSGETHKVMTSTDGVNWTPQNAIDGVWTSVAYGGGVFVAVGWGGVNQIMSSSDNGVTWTDRGFYDVSQKWSSVTYGGGKFVAVAANANSGVSLIMYSNDGLTWNYNNSMAAAGAGSYYYSVTYGNGLYALTSYSAYSSYVLVTSNPSSGFGMNPSDFTKWSYHEVEANQWGAITHGNGVFVAVATNGTNRILTSADGVTWTPRAAPVQAMWGSVTYGDGIFVSVAKNSPSSYVITSP